MTRKSYRTPDHHLWDEVAASIRPSAKKAAKSVAAASPAPKPVKAEVAPPRVVAKARPSVPPPLSGFDRRTEQKLTRGNVEIDDRIDLHGTGIEMARVRLLSFVTSARAQGFRLVLVITGKGASPFGLHTLHGKEHFHAPERQGRLRRSVPDWLHEPEFRQSVIGFQPAHPKHGGGGAFYVKIRRAR